MNKTKLNIYRGVLRDIYVKFDEVEKFILDGTEEISYCEKLSVKEVNYFVYEGLYF